MLHHQTIGRSVLPGVSKFGDDFTAAVDEDLTGRTASGPFGGWTWVGEGTSTGQLWVEADDDSLWQTRTSGSGYFITPDLGSADMRLEWEYRNFQSYNLGFTVHVRYELGTQTDGYYMRIEGTGGSGCRYYAPTGTRLASVGPGGNFQFRIECVGTQHTLWLNDVQVYQDTDATRTTGNYVALKYGSYNINASVMDNFVVEPL